MKRIRSRETGGFVYIRGPGEKPIRGEISFTLEEWQWACQKGKDVSDPEAEREFWKVIVEKKNEDENYNFFDDFPGPGKVQNFGQKVCQQVLEKIEAAEKRKAEKA